MSNSCNHARNNENVQNIHKILDETDGTHKIQTTQEMQKVIMAFKLCNHENKHEKKHEIK